MTRVHITPKSSNGKVGKIPVTTSAAGSCPTTCPMWDGCYAKTGPQSWHWRKVTDGERGGTWDDLAKFVSQLNAGQLWRHNVSGDLFYDTDDNQLKIYREVSSGTFQFVPIMIGNNSADSDTIDAGSF